LPTTVGGDVVRLVGSIQQKHNPVISAASLVADRLIGMLGMVMILPFSFPTLSNGIFKPSSGLPASAPFGASMAVLPKHNWGQKITHKAREGFDQLYTALKLWLSQPRALLVSLAFSWVHMICLFSLMQVLLAGMGEHLSFRLIGGLYSLVYFITLLPISINGYGVQEISMTMIFTNLGRAPVGVGTLPDILAAAKEGPTS
jgi:hypothetical protein